MGIPVLFCGDGEGARIVQDNGFGLVSASGDYAAVAKNIETFAKMSAEDYAVYVRNCLDAAETSFSFSQQMEHFCKFLDK